ncbi:hypothetical protein H0H92_016029 [Tricholoma furcatifolium]|nr:hypothetical protein H0H92_016029 [Tricholoma furcatifolium]
MSRRRSMSTAVTRPGNQAISMQPPHGPTKTIASEVVEKYKSLQRRYHELQEVGLCEDGIVDCNGLIFLGKSKETIPEYERSGDRNVKMHEERSVLLEQITSLENEHPGIQSVASSLQPGPGLGTQSSANGQSKNDTNVHVPNGTTVRVIASPSTLGNGAQANGTSLHESTSPDQQPQQDGSTHPSIANGASSNGHNAQPENIASSSRTPASGPTRNTRRSSRLSGNGEEAAEPESTPKTRGAKRKAPPSPVVKTRTTRGDTAAATLAAAAAQAAQAEETSSSNSGLFATTTTPSSSIHPNQPPSRETVVPSSNSESSIIDPSLVGTSHERRDQLSNAPLPIEHSNIENFAKAALAAQNAAETSEAASTTPSTAVSPPPSNPNTSTTSAESSSPSSTSFNPYSHLKLATPLSMNPYALYYPPGTPVTPGTSPYSPYGNPYYYMGSPVAGPSGVYPPGPAFPAVPNGQRPPPETQHQPKPKRLKAHTVTSKSFSIPVVPRDNKTGKPMLPLNVGIMTVISLGDVCMREHFHTERYIFPVGYEVTRRYLSTVDPNIEVVYHCTILDGGDGPKFQIVPSDVPGRPVIAGTATGAWSSIVKQANQIRNRQHSNSVSGPDFFGLGQNTIKHLIQELPNADRLRDYVWQTFVEGGPLGGRHAAVIPALPEEYDSSMPIGAYYPTERDKRKRNIPGAPAPTVPKGISHYPQHIIAQAEQQQQAHVPSPGEPLGSNLSSAPAPQIDTSLMGLQTMQNADITSQSVDGSSTAQLGAGVMNAQTTATIVSIMNAYSASAGSSAPTPTE